MTTDAEFDDVAADYDEQLHRGVSLSGERKEYFAEARVAWLKQRLGHGLESVHTVMDYGCGTGSAIPYLRDTLRARTILGVDVSSASLETARALYGSESIRFVRPTDYAPRGQVQLVFSNGTFHHIPPRERPSVLRYLANALAPGGWLAIWENNPWNPGTRMVMKRIPFDRDAITISASRLARLARDAGFAVERTDFLFVFPHALRALRGLEPALARWPLGAQYLMLARKAPDVPGFSTHEDSRTVTTG